MARKAKTTNSPRRRRYVERPDIRATMLDAAEALIRSEGYGAATARRIASSIGMKHQSVFYYFGSQDELLVEVFRRSATVQRDRLDTAIRSNSPLRAMWDIQRDPEATKLTLEFMALANHNALIRAELARHAEDVRRLEAIAIDGHLKVRGIEPRLSPQFVSILTNAMARLLVQEATLGIHLGHEEAEALVNASFTRFEADGDLPSQLAPVVDAISKAI